MPVSGKNQVPALLSFPDSGDGGHTQATVTSPPNQIIHNQLSAGMGGGGIGGANSAPRGHWAATRDIFFGCHDWEGAPGMSQGESFRTQDCTLPAKELSGPRHPV